MVLNLFHYSECVYIRCLHDNTATEVFENLHPGVFQNDQFQWPGARFNKEVQPTLSLNLNSELSYSEMGNSEFSVTEQLNCVSLLNSK